MCLHNNNRNEADKQQILKFDENQAKQELNPKYPATMVHYSMSLTYSAIHSAVSFFVISDAADVYTHSRSLCHILDKLVQ